MWPELKVIEEGITDFPMKERYQIAPTIDGKTRCSEKRYPGRAWNSRRVTTLSRMVRRARVAT
jgi:hypothetical protein